jgi:tetratricopeptide (TPR) repeat protein
MSRAAKYKVVHVLFGAVLCLGLAGAYALWKPSAPVVLVAVLVLLTLSRVQGWFWRDFFRGRRLLVAGRARDACIHFERWLAELHRRPALRRLIWLNGAIYTRDAEAMTLNNLGVARLHLGDLRGAQQALEGAVSRDPQYPLPRFNLAFLAKLEGREHECAELLTEARRLGYRGATFDRLCAAAGTYLAQVEGRGSSAPPPGHCIQCGYSLTGNVSGRCPECGTPVHAYLSSNTEADAR